MKILLVGGGVTSAITGICLRKLLPDCDIRMWDKARATGGRMTTAHCTLNANCIADLGAQYITTTDEYIQANGDIYNDLISTGSLVPLQCNIIGMKPQGNKINFVAPKGMSHIVKNLFETAHLNQTKFHHHVSSINEANGKWLVETKSGEKEDFDLVILTMPIPQLFLLEGTLKKNLENFEHQLKTVTYSSRYALVLFFFENLNESWGAQYLDTDPIFRYVAIDNVKRNQPKDLCAVIFHTTVSFGNKHIEATIPDVEKILIHHVNELFPNWPEPKAVKCHKWRYSQVTNTYTGVPNCLVLSTSPSLIVGGDGFAGSTFDNCIKSSKSICDKVKEALQVGGRL